MTSLRTPKSWRLMPLGALVSEPLSNGRSVPDREDGFPVLRLTAIKSGRIDLNEHKCGDWDAARAAPFLVRRGDFLVSRGNGSRELVARGGIVSDDSPRIAFPDTMIRVRINEELISLQYLSAVWDSPGVRGQIERMVRTTSGIYKVNQRMLGTLLLPVPPLAEQRKLAGVLDEVDALRTKRCQALGVLDDLVQSIFFDMFGNLATPSGGWPVCRFDEVVEEFRYGTSNKSANSGYPALRIPNVMGGMLDLAEMKTVPVTVAELERLRLVDGDLLFVRTNGNQDNVGRCAIFDPAAVERQGMSAEDFIYASYLIRARLRQDKVLPVFVRELMLGPAGRHALKEQSKTSAGQFNINIQGIGSVATPVPPIEMQEAFAKKIEAIEAEKTKHREALAKLDELFASVQSRAFAGTLFG